MEQNGKSRQQQQQQKRKSAWSLPPFQKAMWEALAGLSEEPSFVGPASVKNFRWPSPGIMGWPIAITEEWMLSQET